MKKCMRQLSWGKLNLWNKSFFLSIIFFVLENFVIFRLAPLVSKKKKDWPPKKSFWLCHCLLQILTIDLINRKDPV